MAAVTGGVVGHGETITAAGSGEAEAFVGYRNLVVGIVAVFE